MLTDRVKAAVLDAACVGGPGEDMDLGAFLNFGAQQADRRVPGPARSHPTFTNT